MVNMAGGPPEIFVREAADGHFSAAGNAEKRLVHCAGLVEHSLYLTGENRVLRPFQRRVGG